MTALISLPAYPACNLRQTHLHLAKGGRRQKHPELYCERSYHVPCQAGWRNWAGYVRDYLWPFLIKKLSERLLCSCWGRQPAQCCRARVLMLGLFHFPFVFLRHCAPMCPCTSASWAVFFFVPCRLSCPLLLPPKRGPPQLLSFTSFPNWFITKTPRYRTPGVRLFPSRCNDGSTDLAGSLRFSIGGCG